MHPFLFFRSFSGRIHFIPLAVLMLSLFGHHHTFGAVHYISPSGTDRPDCTGGTRDNPWKTWRAAKQSGCIAPGDTVYLMAGTYDSGTAFFEGNNQNVIGFDGTAGNPVTLAVDPEASGQWPVQFRGEVRIRGNHGIIKGLEFYGNGERPMLVGANYISIQSCYIHGRPEDVNIDAGQIASYDCVKILAGSTTPYHHIEVIDCEIFDCAEDAIDVTGARDIVYRGNQIYNARVMQVKGGTENILIEGNEIHTMRRGIIGQRMQCSDYCGSPVLPTLPVEERHVAKNVTIRNNLFYDIRADFAIGANGWRDVEILHNTFYDAGNSAVLKLGSSGSRYFDSIALNYCENNSCNDSGNGWVDITYPAQDIVFRNNIIQEPGNYAIIADSDAIFGFVAEGNIYYKSNDAVRFQVGGSTYNLNNAPIEDASTSYERDPGLADVNDLKAGLENTSFAIDRGLGTDVTDDFFGDPRDGSPDIGAIEQGVASQTAYNGPHTIRQHRVRVLRQRRRGSRVSRRGRQQGRRRDLPPSRRCRCSKQEQRQ